MGRLLDQLRFPALICTVSFCVATTSWAQPANQSKKSTTNSAGAMQKQENKSANQPKTASPKSQPNVSKERRAELMAFVKQHHPEIRPLLNSLQKSRPSQYQATLRQMDREVRSINSHKTRFPARYKKMLAHWVTKSQIKLLSARLALKKKLEEQQALEKQILRLIQKQQSLRTDILKLDIERTRKRLIGFESELKKIKNNGNADAQRQVELIKKRTAYLREQQQKSAAKKKTDKRKAGNNPADKNARNRDKDDSSQQLE